MMGRRTAAMLCVLLGHALVVFVLMSLTRPKDRPSAAVGELVFLSELLSIPEDYDDQHLLQPEAKVRLAPPPTPDMETGEADSPVAGESAAITPPSFVDWPKERSDAAARVLAAEAEAERIARMFAGPDGTWASLTKRQQSELNHFRWKPGVDGLERDENGNTIYRVNDRCVLVNFLFIGCALGAKPPAYGDLFKDMRLYFDEQRRPRTHEGNGTEPESKRPPKWSKPLPDKNR